MNTVLLISHTSDQMRLALLKEKEKTPLEFRLLQPSQIGNIYKGTVLDIHKNLGFAFLDIGEKTPGLLPLSPSFWNKPPFQKGSSVTVQVTRDKVKQTNRFQRLEKEKNVRLSLTLSFSSAFFIFQPTISGIKFSKTTSKEAFSEEFLSQISDLLSENEGLILKPLASKTSFEILERDLSSLKDLWKTLQGKIKDTQKSGLLLPEKESLFRYIFQNSDTLKKIIVDHTEDYLSLKRFLEIFNLSSFISLESHLPVLKGDLFNAYDVQERWDAAPDPVIPLSPSGHLILEKTSAFWTFDVNSSSDDTSQKSFSPFELNTLAGLKILEEVRLKNLGGTIVVDFLPMPSFSQRKKLLTLLQKHAQEDSLQTHIHHISPLGLCEITRPKIEPSFLEEI